ncbi:Fc.00g095280.m01.CDS01 [Cosmosporella sp. VM-42]
MTTPKTKRKHKGAKLRKPRPLPNFQSPPTGQSRQSWESSSFSQVEEALEVEPPSNSRASAGRAVFKRPKPLPGSPLRSYSFQRGQDKFAGDIDPCQVGDSSNVHVQPPIVSKGQTRIRPTGPHDDALARARGTYREPSLRRDSGMVVETPAMMRKDIKKRKKEGTWGYQQAQQIATPPTSSPSRASKGETATGSELSAEHNQVNSKEQRQLIDALFPFAEHQATNFVEPEQLADQPRPLDNAPNTTQQFKQFLFADEEKEKVLRVCLKHQQIYLGLPLQSQDGHAEIWGLVLSKLRHKIKNKVGDWRQLRSKVGNWCRFRRELMNSGILRTPRDDRRQLDEAIDSWNAVWIQRFRVGAWPAIEDKIVSLIQSEIHDFATKIMDKRRDELAALTRPPILLRGSSIESYHNHVDYLSEMVKARGQNSFQVRESEAVMALLLELKPQLESIVRQSTFNQRYEDDPKAGEIASSGTNSEQAILRNPRSTCQGQDKVDLPLVEPETPVTTLQTLDKLHRYEQAFRQAKRLDKEVQARTGIKRKPAAEFEHTSQGTSSKRLRVGSHVAESPRSTASSFSFPSLNRLLFSYKTSHNTICQSPRDWADPSPVTGRAESSLFEQDDCSPPKSDPPQSSITIAAAEEALLHSERSGQGSFQTSTKTRRGRSRVRSSTEASGTNQTTTNRTQSSHRQHSRTIKQVSQSAFNDGTDDDTHEVSPTRFRESTAEFFAMTPESREAMLWQEVKSIRRRTGRF